MNIDEEERKKLDAFIEENFEPPPPSFNAMHNDGRGDEQKSEEEREKQRLEDFIRENIGQSGPGEKRFANIIEDMREELGLEPSGLYKSASITRFHYSKLIGPDKPQPKRNTVIALAFPLIKADTRKNAPPIYEPEERMKILLYSGGGINYVLRKGSIFDLVILYCIREKKFDIDEVNKRLDYKGLPPLTKPEKDDEEG
jgi:hypothetical protein